MKLLIAKMSHETNTFSPVPTPLIRFGAGKDPPEGAAALAARDGRSTMAGMLSIAESRGLELVTPIAAGAPPSGPVDRDAYAYMTQTIIDAIGDCDGILLELHGAMVTQDHDDGEGTLLARIRAEYPDIPIGVGLDMHANLFPEMVNNSTVITGFQTYPHIDTFETGVRAANVLLDALAGRVNPTMVWGNCPMLPHVMRQGTDDFPNRELQNRVREMERDQALAVSLFTGFPHADIYHAGLSVVVVTDNNPELAGELRDELLEMAWRDRSAFVYQRERLVDSLAKGVNAAAEPGDGPVILLDHYDNTASGGTMDTTEVLAAILEAGIEDVAAFGIFDPGAVESMIEAGVGSEVTLSLGGKFHMDALPEQSQPITVSGTVKLISDGQYTVTGPMSTGATMHMGKTAVLDTGKVRIVVVSQHVEPFDLGCFTSLGIDPLNTTYLMLKSRIHYRAAFKPIAKSIIECAGRGVCTSDYDELTFEKVRRSIYPLDNINHWEMSQGISGAEDLS